MTKLEKLDAGLEYCLYDAGVVTRKENALKGCAKFNAIDPADYTAQLAAIKELFGSAGKMCASSLISTVTTEKYPCWKGLFDEIQCNDFGYCSGNFTEKATAESSAHGYELFGTAERTAKFTAYLEKVVTHVKIDYLRHMEKLNGREELAEDMSNVVEHGELSSRYDDFLLEAVRAVRLEQIATEQMPPGYPPASNLQKNIICVDK